MCLTALILLIHTRALFLPAEASVPGVCGESCVSAQEAQLHLILPSQLTHLFSAASLVNFDSFYLESESCLVCNDLEVQLSVSCSTNGITIKNHDPMRHLSIKQESLSSNPGLGYIFSFPPSIFSFSHHFLFLLSSPHPPIPPIFIYLSLFFLSHCEHAAPPPPPCSQCLVIEPNYMSTHN